MKKALLTAILVVGFTAWSLYLRHTQEQVVADTAVTSSAAFPIATTTAQPVQTVARTTPVTQKPTTITTTPTTSTSTTKSATGKYIDGSYIGSVADAYYGNLQVKAVISGGKLTDVQFLQYPNDRSTSRQISNRVLPQLRQEAIQSQSANVQTISGATDVSGAFRQSLSYALTQATR